MLTDAELRFGLDHCLAEATFTDLGPHYAGKVRDCYDRGDDLVLIASDRVSAFDRVIGLIPYKGQILTQLAAYWFTEMGDRFPSHFKSAPDPSVTIGKKCRPFALEMVVRSYLTGVTSTSIWYHYERGQRDFGGITLRDGMRKNEQLPKPLLTPSTKAEKGHHDETVSRQALLDRKIVTPAELDEIEALCLGLFAEAQTRLAARGVLLVDTKYELGRDPEGRIVFIDEVHTPDSSRLWDAGDYAERVSQGEEPTSLDKEYLRRYLKSVGYAGEGPPPPLPDEVRAEMTRRYATAFERTTGRAFVPETSEPLPRIRKQLGLKP